MFAACYYCPFVPVHHYFIDHYLVVSLRLFTAKDHLKKIFDKILKCLKRNNFFCKWRERIQHYSEEEKAKNRKERVVTNLEYLKKSAKSVSEKSTKSRASDKSWSPP